VFAIVGRDRQIDRQGQLAIWPTGKKKKKKKKKGEGEDKEEQQKKRRGR